MQTSSLTQKIIVNPATQSIGVINSGPMGPTGLTGPSDTATKLTVDGQLLTRVAGLLAPITRAALAADSAFTAAMTAHVAAADPHPGYMTTAEDAAIMSAHVAAADPHPGYLTSAEGDTAYVNVGGDTISGTLNLTVGNGALRFATDPSWIGFYSTTAYTTRRGYIQGSTGGLTINSEAGVFALTGAGGFNFTGGRLDCGAQYIQNCPSVRSTSGELNLYPATNGGMRMNAGYAIYNDSDSHYFRHSNLTQYMCIDTTGVNVLYAGLTVAAGLATQAPQWKGNNNGTTWNVTALLAYPNNGGACAAFHPGGFAVVGGAINGLATNFYFRNASFTANTATVVAAGHIGDSSRRWKKNIASWPPKSLGAASEGAVDIVTRLKPITSQRIAVDSEIPGPRRTKAWERLNRIRANKGQPNYELPVHDCSIHPCPGTINDPCQRVREVELHRLGLLAEDLYEVAPQIVQLDIEKKPAGIDLGQLIVLSLAAIQELTERIKMLEESNG